MKRYIYTILLVFAAVSCQSELIPENECHKEMMDMTVEAVVEERDADTKTSLGGTNASSFRDVLWDKDDAIAFFASGSTNFSKFTNLNDSDGQKIAVFSGSVEESKQYAAFYPYENMKSLGSGKVSFTLPQTQTYESDDFATGMSPMIGRLDNDRLSFKNLCGILVLNLKGEGTVSSVSFSGYDEEGNEMPVAGTVKVAYDYASEPEIDMTGAGVNTVTLNCGDGVALSESSATPFHIMLPPGQYHDFKLTIAMKDGSQMIKKGTTPITIKRSERTRTKSLTYVETAPHVDLNKSGETANSYIISTSGDYKFKAVKGNSSTSVGTVASVEVLWESFGTSVTPSVGSLVKNVSYKDGYIQFSTPSTFKEGNAVIAAKNSSGTILWSWHIWLTDKPEEQVYANYAGTMMDRNLGATSATPGDVGALGLLYQWGRKDPFLGSSSISDNVEAKSTGSWPSAVSSSSSIGTISYATKNPMTFITYNESNYDWYYTGDDTTDNTRWQSSKTIYDPCPPGWRVPDGGSNGVWAKAGFDDHAYDDTDEGMLFGSAYSSPSAWYPASGYRNYGSGSLYGFGDNGRYWSVTPGSSKNAYHLSFNYSGHFFPWSVSGRAFGLSVRCLKEGSSSDTPVETEYKNLSTSGTANSYIVSTAGDYKFKTVQGNSSESVGSVSSVEVLWESFGTSVTPSVGSLVKNVSYKDGYIQFSTPSTFKEGNAVIAAKNSSGTILWSWHIWLTDKPEEQVYANYAGTMMDRNLGATSATPGDVGALGLLYQWGRKDPFLGSSSIHDEVEAKSTGSWPLAVTSSSSIGTIAYATKNPMTFIKSNESNYDWYYTGDDTTDNTRWQSSKTIYDPCPPGWRVPDGGSNGVWAKAGFDDHAYDDTDEGMLFGSAYSSPSAWYPASGYRFDNSGSLYGVGNYGDCWSVTPNGGLAYGLFFDYGGYVYASFRIGRAYGQSVRCLKEGSSSDIPVETEYKNLSTSGTANSYIVSTSGDYKFKAVKGNSSTSVGTVASVEVLWESFGTSVTPSVGSLVKNVSYKDGYIQFSTPSTFKEGNAVIAAKNSSGTILWSWHIWLTDKPEEQVYANYAGTMMDRNLGATSATPGDVGALGLLYQWGRKDPFLGSSSIHDEVEAKSTGSWPSAVTSSSSIGTIAYATKNPMTFIKSNDDYDDDWYYKGDGSPENTRWQSSKTIYDPCPAGWRVPDGGKNGIWEKVGFDAQYYDDVNNGMLFDSEYSSPSAWYPASGYRRGGSNSLLAWGYSGDYWSCTHYLASSPSYVWAYDFSFLENGRVDTYNVSPRANAQSVRCFKEGSSSDIPVETGYKNLSTSGTANSYIVSAAGDYKFKTVQGNSSESVGSVSSVEVLWESFGTSVTPSVGSLVKNVSYKDGYIQFSTPSTFKEGNAVIAAKNSSGTILWSWHIWLTDKPEEQVYANYAGTMMDRNLGATSATPGDVGALGLLYQWGRKDPFLGSSSISDNVEAKSTGSWPSDVESSSSIGTISYATKNPMTFITYNESNSDWYYTGDGTTDNTRWQSSKTIYDPCPPGWRVPDGGSNGIWAKAGFDDHVYDDANEGMEFDYNYCSTSTWYPASGYRSYGSGSLYGVGFSGLCWSVTPSGKRAYGLYFSSSGSVNASYSIIRAYGQSVRCLQE